MDFKQSYFACLNPNIGPYCLRKNPISLISGEEEDNFLSGTVLCCDSMTKYDIYRCNQRLLVNKEYSVASKLKVNMVRLGIDCEGKEESIQKEIKEMEKRDKEG